LIFLIIWEIGSSGGWVDRDGMIKDEPGAFHIGYAVLATLGVILSAPNALVWISLALAGLSFVTTAVLDFSGRTAYEATPVGLGAFLVSIIVAYFALLGEDVKDVPDWALGCLLYFRVFGGMALMVLGMLGCATNPEIGPGSYNISALGIGLLAIIVGYNTRDWRL
jgi:hypothetical protein